MADQQFVIMAVGSERYGVDVQQVKTIEKKLAITPVPRTLSYIKGVINLHGSVTPVIDLRERLNLPLRDEDADFRIVIVELPDMMVGMIVDSVPDIAMIAVEQIEVAPSVVGGLEATYLRGVARLEDELVVLLNLPRLLSQVEVSQLQEVEKSLR